MSAGAADWPAGKLIPIGELATLDDGTGRAAVTALGRQVLSAVPVVMGHDLLTGGVPICFYGREALGAMVETGVSAPLPVLHVALDFQSNEVELLAGAIKALRGHECYSEAPAEPTA